MTVQEMAPDAIVRGATTLPLSQFFTTSTVAPDPAYLILTALDRNEYTATSTAQTGSFAGNGATLDFAPIGDDGRGCGIVFTWNAATGQYSNATYGALSSLEYTASASPQDITNISLFGTNNAALAQQDAGNAYALMQQDASGYFASATIATEPAYTASVPAAATPDGVAAIAAQFVGDAWNENGCWVLASTIAAEAGASLPVQSTAIGVPGHANGEWIVLYNGPAGAGGNWQSLVSTGDIVSFGTPGGGGHITTCVSGSGATAMLIDNITYENNHGQVTNLANDGSGSDIIIAAPHPASQEWNGVAAGSVVIYALDTPAITDASSSVTMSTGKTLSLATEFKAADPAHRAITAYQVYDTGAGSLTLGGAVQSAHSASTAVTASSLGALALQAGSGSGAATIDIRAYNGDYWGDWQTLAVAINAPPPLPPVLTAHTPNQMWKQGVRIALLLPANLFVDPQHLALSYTASGAGGAALPAWLSFSAAADELSGTVPAGLENFSVAIKATDTAGLSASESFTVTVPAAAPMLATPEPAQAWLAGAAVECVLPQPSFIDPQGELLRITAAQSNGAPLPAWLHFSPASLAFSGTAPASAQTLQLKITATDTSLLSGTETLSVTIEAAAHGLLAQADWTGLAAAQVMPAQPTPSHASGLMIFEAPAGQTWEMLAHHPN